MIQGQTNCGAAQSRIIRLPGLPGIWVFVIAEMCLFTLLFVSYTIEQAKHVDIFAQSQRTLDVGLGLANTLILLSSSWFVALAVHAARNDEQKRIGRFLLLAILCGASFAVIKCFEYGSKFGAGISMLTNDFYMHYFAITGIHFLHLISATIVLIVIASKAKRGGYGPDKALGIETGAIYWHMVDLLWVMIFPLFYLANWQ